MKRHIYGSVIVITCRSTTDTLQPGCYFIIKYTCFESTVKCNSTGLSRLEVCYRANEYWGCYEGIVKPF